MKKSLLVGGVFLLAISSITATQALAAASEKVNTMANINPISVSIVKTVNPVSANNQLYFNSIQPVNYSFILAENIKAGTFGANTSGGNFTFPNNLIVNGNVGIGTTNPQQLLHVNGNALIAGPLDLGANGLLKFGRGPIMTEENGNLAFRYASNYTFETGNVSIGTTDLGTAKLAVIGGNVGINTINPDATLTVNGSTKTNSMVIGAGINPINSYATLVVNGSTKTNSIKADQYYAANGNAGLSNIYHLKASNGQNCTMTFSIGLLTASTCP